MPKCFVVGAGVVGIAVARALARRLRSTSLQDQAAAGSSAGSSSSSSMVVLMEAASAFGTQTSSRNSEVIHSGIYYTPGSNKAVHCVRGAEMLYPYLQQRGVAHRQCGKIIVATSPREEEKLSSIMKNGVANGVKGLEFISPDDIRSLEPSVRGVRAILVPSTGIVDSHGLMEAMLTEAEENGAIYIKSCSFLGAKAGPSPHRYAVHTSQGVFEADVVVNCAGLAAPAVAARIEPFPRQWVPKAYFSKGSYFKLQGCKPPFSRLVYPVPVEHGLGVHATIDISGGTRFGPDTQWIEPAATYGDSAFDATLAHPLEEWSKRQVAPLQYAVDAKRGESFVEEIRKYWPELPDDALCPDYSGVRPKLVGADPSEALARAAALPWKRDLRDFVIEGPGMHGVPGLVNLFGIESPGLTSCMSIAEHVTNLLENDLK